MGNKVCDRFPIKTMSLVMTENCSLRCDYCFCGKKQSREIDFKKAKKAVDWFLKPSVSDGKANSMNFWGGEPMLKWDLIKKVVEYTKSKKEGLNFSLTTNGMHFDEKTIEEMVEYEVGALISLDGGPESHNKHRKLPNGEGSYHIIEKNLKRYLKYRPNANVRISLSKDNLKNFSNDLKHIYNLGFRNIFWSLVYEADWNHKDAKILKNEYYKIAEFYIKKVKEGDPFGVKMFRDGWREMLYPNKNSYFCGAARTYVGVGVDLRIYPCHRFDDFENKQTAEKEEFCIGTIEKGITKPDIRKMFCDAMSPSYCKECKLFKVGFCHGGCYAANYTWNKKDILYTIPIHCKETEARFEILNYIYEKLKHTGYMKRKINRIHKRKGNAKNLGSIPCK
ncbi:MAG: radical SAM protein, partial [archaeon]